MKQYEAVIFDMDGVIFDSERCVLDCWIKIAEKYGIRDIERSFLACTGTNKERTREIMIEEYGSDFPYDRFSKEASKLFHDKYDNGNLPVKPGVNEILTFLKNEKKKIALASSTRREIVLSQLRDAGVLDYFDEVVTGDMVTKSKPDPEIFLLACRKIGVTPDKSYAIEDSYNGVRSASRGGLMTIMVPDLLPADDEMKGLSEIVLDSLYDVVDFLAKEIHVREEEKELFCEI
ncbi:MAG: HAD family phosphatase [Lachnospiraceae bacterium]|nr:HAD family phosphatase [Lachnospiraceae bacterium]